MPKVKVRIINKSNNPLPEYATEGSAGMDLRAFIEEYIVIQPGDRVMVPTGIFIELPEGFEAQVRPRSGLAIKQGITCLNSPGTIDSDYRGEIHAILINLSKEEQRIHSGDRVAQLVVQKYERVKWKQVNKMSETKRGEGGFGHTGKK